MGYEAALPDEAELRMVSWVKKLPEVPYNHQADFTDVRFRAPQALQRMRGNVSGLNKAGWKAQLE